MPIRIANVITRMIVGGPQQVCLLSGAHYKQMAGIEFHLVAGVETGAEGDYAREIAALGVPYHPVPALIREVSPATDARALWDLVRLFRTMKPHVVHARSAKARFLAPLAARIARVPVVVQTVHGWSFNNAVDRRKRFFVKLEAFVRRFCDVNVMVSEQDLDEGERLGVLPRGSLASGKAAIVRSGVDLTKVVRSPEPERQRLRKELWPLNESEGPLVALVQRMSEPKTPLVFVEAFARLHKKHPTARALFVGDGALRAETEQAVAAAGLSACTVFAGLRKDIPAVLSAVDVAVHSSIREGLPRVVLETLAVGTPLIATRVGGVPSVAKDGENSLTVPAQDAEALYRALDATLSDPAAAALRAKAGTSAVYPFSAQKMLDDQHALYTRLLAARGISLPSA